MILPVRVIVCMTVLVEIDSLEELPVTGETRELLADGDGGRTPLEMDPLPETVGEVAPLVVTEVRVSGQTVVESGTTEVTIEESGQLETEDAQL